MAFKSVVSSQRRLDATFSRINLLSTEDLEVRSDFARYLCILVSAFIEKSLSTLAGEHCRRLSAPTVSRFAQKKLDRLKNVNSEKLLQFMGSFDPELEKETKVFIDGSRKEALDSVVALRNQIAHGESVGVTYVQMNKYYKEISEIINFVTNKFS